LRRRIFLAQANERASIEIVRRGNPGSALAPLARVLMERDEPVSFDGLFVSEQVGIG
jgi:hypothetical protein